MVRPSGPGHNEFAAAHAAAHLFHFRAWRIHPGGPTLFNSE